MAKNAAVRAKFSRFMRLWNIRERLEWLNRSLQAREHSAHPTPYISIIISIYDTERYVEKCIRSVMAQTLDEIEIICVDDASPDGSAAIVKALAREDSRIRLIQHDRNLGTGGAHNTGVTAARAPYVTGIDSDDYILPEMMERLWQASDAGAVDIVACGFSRVNNDGTPRGLGYLPKAGFYCNDDHQINIFEFLNPSFWGKIWRKSLFTQNRITFPENNHFDDLAAMPQLVRFAKSIRVIPEDLYRYVIRPGSITSSYNARHIIDHFKTFELLDDFLVREGLVERYGEDFTERVRRSLSFVASNIISSNMDERQKEQSLRFCYMLKYGYLSHKDRLRNVPSSTLQSLIQASESYPAPDLEWSTKEINSRALGQTTASKEEGEEGEVSKS